MAALTLKTAVANYGHTKPLKDGTVKSEKITLEHVEVPSIVGAFRRMIRGLEFDVSEMSLSTYICARAHNKPITAIPVFLVRGFHHGALSYNTRSGITGPADLAGRKVGVRAYTVTTGVWARDILQKTYGVDLSKVTWVVVDEEHVQEYNAPPNVMPAPEGADLASLLVSGEIDAAIGAGNVDSPHVEPLIPDAGKAAATYFRQTGVYPINHTLVIKDELLATTPWLAEELFATFKAAKENYLARLGSGQPLDRQDEAMVERKGIVGDDPIPYGLEANRKTLEVFIQSNVDQKVIPQMVKVEELFAPSTLTLS